MRRFRSEEDKTEQLKEVDTPRIQKLFPEDVISWCLIERSSSHIHRFRSLKGNEYTFSRESCVIFFFFFFFASVLKRGLLLKGKRILLHRKGVYANGTTFAPLGKKLIPF